MTAAAKASVLALRRTGNPLREKMLEKFLHKKYSLMLEQAGVEINGGRPWDILVNNPDTYRRVFFYGTLGLGESYMDRWWDCERLDQFFTRVFSATGGEQVGALPHLLNLVQAALFNMQNAKRAFHVGEKHYDTSPEFMRKMLGKSMIYSCGYWKDAQNLEQAQEAKLKLIMDKLMLEPGMEVLDIGCGWGGAAKYAAENYGVSVTGITVSKQQADVARKQCRGLPVKILLQDYRLLDGQFDRAYSIGMFEHVGYKNHSNYMKVVRGKLKQDGLFVLHTIGNDKSRKSACPWINKYIFPGGLLPSAVQISKSCEKVFVLEDWQNFGNDYDKTLMAWHENFQRHWQGHGAHDERFYRMWSYYLMICAAAFRARTQFLWQIVLSPGGMQKVYYAPR